MNQGGLRLGLGPEYHVSKHSGVARMVMLIVWVRWPTDGLLAFFSGACDPSSLN